MKTLAEAVNGLAETFSPKITAEQVAERAYFRWLERGCPPGSAEYDWLEAERELTAAK